MSTVTKQRSVAVAIKPLHDRVVVQALEEEDVTPGGIVLPDSAKEKPQKGKVLAVGPGRITDHGNHIPMTVKVGDVILYTKYGPTEVNFNNQEYLVVSESDILGIIEG